MIHHHHSTPLLIDFYSPSCGPCKLMKGEISSIRDELDLLGPAVVVSEEEEEEDCAVEDVIALSSVCLEDGYIEEQQQLLLQGVGEGAAEAAAVGREDVNSLLQDLLPPPPKVSTTKEQATTTTSSKQQSDTTPSGIPVYHVNTNKFPQVGAKNHIAGLPTLVLFYKGQELWRNEGLMKGEEIVRILRGFQAGGWQQEGLLEKEGSSVQREEEEEGEVNKKKRKGRRLGG